MALACPKVAQVSGPLHHGQLLYIPNTSISHTRHPSRSMHLNHRHRTTASSAHLPGALRHRQQRQTRPAALPEAIDGLVTTAAIGAGMVGILVSFLSAPAADDIPERPDASDDNFKWGVMGVIGCIPLVNWTSWIFGALDFTGNPNPKATLYYFYAAVYALPLLRNGFEQDTWSVSLLLLGIAHLQVERMSVTEPDVLEELSSKLSISKALKAGTARLLEAVRWSPVRKVLKEEERKSVRDLEDSKELQQEELRMFDRQLQKRRQGQQGKRKGGWGRKDDDAGW